MEVKPLSFEDIQELKETCLQFCEASKAHEVFNATTKFEKTISIYTILRLIKSYEDMREAFFREMYD